jgi:hypothetical protein
MEYFICDMTATGADAEFYLNEIPLTRLVLDVAEREAMPVNHFLINGENRLGILIRPGSTPAKALSEVRTEKSPVPIRVSARLSAYPPGAIPGEDPGRDIAIVEHTIPVDHETRFPLYVETRFDYVMRYGRWAWQTAPQFTLDDRLRSTVHAVLTQLTASLQRADPALFLRLASLRFEENAVAFGEDLQARRQKWAAGLQQLSQKPNWIFAPPALETMSLRLCADSRLLDCKAADWNPIIRARQNEHGVHLVRYPMLLANIGGQLQIVR